MLESFLYIRVIGFELHWFLASLPLWIYFLHSLAGHYLKTYGSSSIITMTCINLSFHPRARPQCHNKKTNRVLILQPKRYKIHALAVERMNKSM